MEVFQVKKDRPLSRLSIDKLRKENGLTDKQLDQPIPEHKLFDVASVIPNWYDYAGTPGLELDEGDKLSISADPHLYDNRLKVQRALELWHKRNPYEATYRNLLKICLQRKHGDTAVKIVKEVLLEQEETVFQLIAESTQPSTVLTPTQKKRRPSLYDHVDSVQNTPLLETSNDFDENSLTIKSRRLMKKEFSVLYTSLRLEMSRKEITGSDLRSHLVDMEMFGSEMEPVYNYQDITLGTAISSSTIPSCPTLEDVFHLMAPYCSWFNHLLIESIIDVFFADDDNHVIHKKFALFKQKFDEYCKDRKDLMGQDFGSDKIDGTISTIFKIDHLWDSIRIEQLPLIIEALAEALKIRKQNLLLRTVNNGCLELNIAMSNHQAEQLFPLQEDILSALRDRKVLKYEQPPWVCRIDNALKGIEESRKKAAKVQFRLRLLQPGSLAITARSVEALPVSYLLPVGAPKVDELTIERIRSKAIRVENSPGAVAGLMLASVGEQVQSEFLSLPEERPHSTAIQTLEGLGYYAAAGSSPWYSFLLGLGVLIPSTLLRYTMWRVYPHNHALKQTLIVESCESIGTFAGSVAASLYCSTHSVILGKNYDAIIVLALCFAGGTILGRLTGKYLTHRYF